MAEWISVKELLPELHTVTHWMPLPPLPKGV